MEPLRDDIVLKQASGGQISQWKGLKKHLMQLKWNVTEKVHHLSMEHELQKHQNYLAFNTMNIKQTDSDAEKRSFGFKSSSLC